MSDGAPQHDPLDWTTAQQARASSPAASAWVAANAGSGKTHVLSQRVIRLLLSGVRPSSILCLTYTKAAASEMANRVFARLAEWTRFTDDKLHGVLSDLDGQAPSPGRMALARQLFALALETPGGLKIQTIHAFCEAVLHQFPLEANVAGHFAVMDDGETATLMAEARRLLLTATSIEDDAELADAFAVVLEAAGEQGLETLLDDLVSKRADIARFEADALRHGGVTPVLFRAAGLSAGESEDDIKAAVWPLPSMPQAVIGEYAAVAHGHKAATPKKFADGLMAACNAGSAHARWSVLASIFLTKAGAKASINGAATKDVAAVLPDAGNWIDAASDHFMTSVDRLKTRRMVDATLAALTLARRFAFDYERLKRQRGRLDFDDLVRKTAHLLNRQGAGGWVHYKLDQGIDHILVDEAQDTSPAQWSIIRGLSDEFFAGEENNRPNRTLFAVGDDKQSIYSFQGAEPARFREEGRAVRRHAEDATRRFEDVELKLSFRSTLDILSGVDRVFADADTRRGVGSSSSAIIHESVRGHEPGLIDVWDMIGKEKHADDEDWTAPFDDTPESDPKARLAARVAATIRQWLATEHRVEKGVRVPLRAGDILVLVRKRDAFVNALMRNLKQNPQVAVAGADRLVLTDHIAVKDLMALGCVLSLPDDDLALAAVLKSPLFDFSEDDLFRLCAGRPERHGVHDNLRLLAAEGHAPFAGCWRLMERYRRLARALPVHDFYARLLGPEGGRSRFLARLGSEAGDVLDAFVAFALDHEASGLPGLRSFLAVLEAQSPEIKRELEQDRDEVRIMTVHASKGLEAPVIFLVDSGGAASPGQHMPRMRMLDMDAVFGPIAPAPLWVPGKDFENTLSLGLKERLAELAEEEYRRLLYVGMTRAADRLVVCGYHGQNPPTTRHWHKMVRDALAAPSRAGPGVVDEMTFATGGLTWEGLRFRLPHGGRSFPEAEKAVMPEQVGRISAVASLSPLPAPSRPPRPLMPSGTGAVIDDPLAQSSAASPLFGAAGAHGVSALERGRIIHRFLQVLPGMAATQRGDAAHRYLQRAAPDWPSEARDGVVRSVLAIFDDPGFGPVFSSDSEPEVAVMGTVRIGGRDNVVSGRIDRLAVFADRVLIADYKTNRPPCRRLDDVPFSYLAQMALYRELLVPLYPGRRIEAALLFTEAPVLLALPQDSLDAALATLAQRAADKST